MKTFRIQTLGCKVNQYESHQIHQWLILQGLTSPNDEKKADLVVINTCCVTQIASAKSRQQIRKAQKQNPGAAIVIAGCLPAGPNEELTNLPVEAVFEPQKDRLPNTLHKIITQSRNSVPANGSKTGNCDKIKYKKDIDNQYCHDNSFVPLSIYDGQTRAFLKIQDGCDAFCTYCIIPKIRTKLSSKPMSEIVQEAENLTNSGHPEIVLTGIFLGAWGHNTTRRRQWDSEQSNRLPELLEKLTSIRKLKRLRLSSLEPADVTDDLIEIYKHSNVLVPHLHLPLQAGSDRVLRRMARQYRIEQFLEISRKLKGALDRPAITTDVIVGFPGETDEDFKQTLKICREVGFAKIHVFPFSPRSGTAAVRLDGQVDSKIIKERGKILNELDLELQEQFRQQFVSETVRVIVESTDPPKGRCDRYFMMDCSVLPEAEKLTKGQCVEVVYQE